mmetsp:Transcript_14776/g.21941  ORF Transcript_14776/g.21941 Transcript_14776/m.21941 type:complete len:133 (+) Transcript_14776:25-423(+)
MSTPDIDRLISSPPAATANNLALKQSVTMPLKSKNNSNKSFQKHTGRKLFTKSVEKNDKKTIGVEASTAHSNEDMDRILEEDSLALLSIKKEISNIQELELKKLQNALLNMQKEYDVLLTANNLAEKKFKGS